MHCLVKAVQREELPLPVLVHLQQPSQVAHLHEMAKSYFEITLVWDKCWVPCQKRQSTYLMTLALNLPGESIRELTEDLRYGIFLLCVSTCISALDAAGSSIQADAKLASNLTAYLQVLKSDLAFPLLLRICLARLRRLCSVAAPPAKKFFRDLMLQLPSLSAQGY